MAYRKRKAVVIHLVFCSNCQAVACYNLSLKGSFQGRSFKKKKKPLNLILISTCVSFPSLIAPQETQPAQEGWGGEGEGEGEGARAREHVRKHVRVWVLVATVKYDIKVDFCGSQLILLFRKLDQMQLLFFLPHLACITILTFNFLPCPYPSLPAVAAEQPQGRPSVIMRSNDSSRAAQICHRDTGALIFG